MQTTAVITSIVFLAACVVARTIPTSYNDTRHSWTNLEGALARHLPDGIIVTQGEELRAQISEWTVLVTLEPPEKPATLLDHVSAVEECLRLSNVSQVLSDDTRLAWNLRLSNLRASLSAPMPSSDTTPRPSRARRGLLDIGGTLLHEIFGVATSAELEKFRRVVETVKQEERTIVHKENELITVLNKTRRDLDINRKRLNNITNFLATVTDKVNELGKNFVYLRRIVHELHLETDINRALTILEHAAQEYVDSRNMYFAQRASLELGKLTETILPIELLTDILTKATELDSDYVKNVYWYYQNIIIEPIWNHRYSLLYVVRLPLISSDSYLSYSIRAWPTPINNSNCTAKLNGRSVVGVHTGDGGVFYPHSCIGKKPAVCLTGPVFYNPRESCTRGILSGNKDQRKYCTISIRKYPEPVTLFDSIGPGKYVVTTWGETCSLRCSGQREVTFYLKPGAYCFEIKVQCSIYGSGWRLDGLRRNITNITLFPKAVENIPPFNLHESLPSLDYYQKLDQPQFNEIGDIAKINIEPLKLPSDDAGLIYPHNIQWSIVGVFVALMLLLGVMLCVRRLLPRQRLCQRSNSFKKVDREDKSPQEDTVSLNNESSSTPTLTSPSNTAQDLSLCMCSRPDLSCPLHQAKSG